MDRASAGGTGPPAREGPPRQEATSYRALRLVEVVLVAGMTAVLFYTAVEGAIFLQKQVVLMLFLVYFGIRRIREGRLKSAPMMESVAGFVMLVLSVACGLYLWFNQSQIYLRIGAQTIPDIVIGLVITLLVVEFARVKTNISLAIIALVFIVYAFVGPYLPSIIGHRGISFARLFTYLSYSDEGIFGSAMAAAAGYILLFVIFGALLYGLVGGRFFIDLATAVAGSQRGGPAKIAVISSGLFGTISGSAAVNVAAVGTFTIPMMKSIGYKADFAGGVEAAASTGGQFLPPVMAAAAFIMAEFISGTYAQVAIAAIVPALIYYVSLYFVIDIEAAALGLSGLPREKRLRFWPTMGKGWFNFLPLFVVVIALLVWGLSAQRSAFLAIMATLAVWLVLFFTTGKPSLSRLKALYTALESAMKEGMVIVAACAICGVVVGVINVTGVGLSLSHAILALAGGNLAILSVLVAIICIVLGMGMPTIPAYIVTAILGAPPMIQAGVAPIQAHMFILILSCMSSVTPPVALAIFTAIGISGGEFWKTAWHACRLSLAGFLVPFLVVLSPRQMMIVAGSTSVFEITMSVLFTIAALYGIAVLLRGSSVCLSRTPTQLRILFFLGGMMSLSYFWQNLLLVPAAGVALLAVVETIGYRRSRAAGRNIPDPGTQP